MFPFTLELETLLAQREVTRTLQRDGVLTPWVFHRADGSRIQTFRQAWRTACRQAAVPARSSMIFVARRSGTWSGRHFPERRDENGWA